MRPLSRFAGSHQPKFWKNHAISASMWSEEGGKAAAGFGAPRPSCRRGSHSSEVD